MARIGKRKKSAAATSLPATRKIGKKTYTKVACSKTKAAAKKKAVALRKAGKTAAVIKNPAGGYCTFAGSRKKSPTKRRRVVRRRKK